MLDQYRRAAGYVDRILKGEKAAERRRRRNRCRALDAKDATHRSAAAMPRMTCFRQAYLRGLQAAGRQVEATAYFKAMTANKRPTPLDRVLAGN